MGRIDLKTVDGRYKTLDELYDEARDTVQDELCTMDSEDALYLGNHIRENCGEDKLFENVEENLNKELGGLDPYDILQIGRDGWDDYSDFFTFSNGDINTTDDMWCDLNEDEIAASILEGRYYDYLPKDLKDYVDEFNKAKDTLLHLNPLREEGKELLNKYKDKVVGALELASYIEKLVKTDEAWREKK